MRDVRDIPGSCDVVVIGAGMGGLTAAAYLAKAGARVVLLEKHALPGGYCTSFTRGGYRFDAAAHSLGSCRPDGQLGRLFADHQLGPSLPMVRYDPTDVIVTWSRTVRFRADWRDTVRELQAAFPHQAASIAKFADDIMTADPLLLFVMLSDLRFADWLDRYFDDEELKSVLAMPLGNLGLPSTRVSALTAVFLYREFLFDGGYYPVGGMQRLPDVLLQRFESYGGVALRLSGAEAIELDAAGAVSGVRLRYRGRHPVRIATRAVVANCDPHQLYGTLLGDTPAGRDGVAQLRNWQPTVSAFMLHLGVRGPIDLHGGVRAPLWAYRRGHVDDYFEAALAGRPDPGEDGFLFCSIPSYHDPSCAPAGHHALHAILLAPYRSRPEWEAEKPAWTAQLLRRLESYAPGVTSQIDGCWASIPPTLVKFTANHRGAMYGMASVPRQVGRHRFPEQSHVEGLWLVGHWTGLPSGNSGIPTVVTAGRGIARTVLRSLRKTRHTMTEPRSVWPAEGPAIAVGAEGDTDGADDGSIPEGNAESRPERAHARG